MTMDFLAFSFLLTLGALAVKPSWSLVALAGLFLGLTSVCAHNWFHLGDKTCGWRRFYFDLSLASSRDWRISHAISHHFYTNTHMDMEISGFELYGLHFLPVTKGPIKKLYQHIYAHISAFLTFHQQFISRTYLVIKGHQKPLVENLIGPAQLIFLVFTTKDPLQSVVFWFVLHGIASYMLVIQFSWTHHHPDLYHAGEVQVDFASLDNSSILGDKPRSNRDWGLHIIDTTRDFDRTSETWGSLSTPIQMVTFGHHLLHHFFPSVDLSKVSDDNSYLLHVSLSWSSCTLRCTRHAGSRARPTPSWACHASL